MKVYYVYILTNKSKTLYIGVTNNVERRLYEHRENLVDGFSSRYNIDQLIYLESTSNVSEAIEREKQLKRWSRQKKITLIERTNPNWRDLSTTVEMTAVAGVIETKILRSIRRIL